MKSQIVTIIITILLITSNTFAQTVITGPWLWITAPTEVGQGGASSTDIDQLAHITNGVVTESLIAKHGAKAGASIGDKKWTFGQIEPTGPNNLNELITQIGLGEGDVNDASVYALITLYSSIAQPKVVMRVGSDDSIKVWLNGEVVFKNAINRAATGYADIFWINLQKGENLLLIKVSEREREWSMFAGIQGYFIAADKVYAPATDAVTLSAIGRFYQAEESHTRDATYLKRADPGALLVGQNAPEFIRHDLNGNPISLTSLKGKPVVLNFWVSWSSPCHTAIKHLEQLHKKYKAKGLTIIGVYWDKDMDDAKTFARKHITYPVLLGGQTQFQPYHVQSVPCTYYIDKTGTIHARDIGFGTNAEKDMEQNILQLLQ